MSTNIINIVFFLLLLSGNFRILISNVWKQLFSILCVCISKIVVVFLNDSDKNGVRGLPHSMPHAYSDILVKVSSEMLQNCGNGYVNFDSASYTLSFLHDVLIYRDIYWNVHNTNIWFGVVFTVSQVIVGSWKKKTKTIQYLIR